VGREYIKVSEFLQISRAIWYISPRFNNSKHWSNEKGPSSTTNIVQRNNSERSNVTFQYIWIQIFLFVVVKYGLL
jgi:hypothetical protein